MWVESMREVSREGTDSGAEESDEWEKEEKTSLSACFCRCKAARDR